MKASASALVTYGLGLGGPGLGLGGPGLGLGLKILASITSVAAT